MTTRTLTLTLDDYAAAQRLFCRTRRWPQVLRAALVVAIAAFLAWLVPDFIADGFTGDDLLLLFLAAYICFLLWMFYAERWGRPLGTRKTFRQQKALQSQLTMGWSIDGYTIESERGRWVSPWSDYLAWAEDKDVLIALQTARMFNLIPKRALEAGDLDEIRSHLQTAGVKRR